MKKAMRSMESLVEDEDDDEEDLPPEAAMWRSVKDQASGKTYYYHICTRESVWDKPLALCSARERWVITRIPEAKQGHIICGETA